jgi:microcystin-dependent protein
VTTKGKSMKTIVLTAALLCATAASAQEVYMSQIIPMAGNGCTRGWAVADGALLQIHANRALFALIGTTYGGDGHNTFALPNLKGGTIGPPQQPITWCIAVQGIFPQRP